LVVATDEKIQYVISESGPPNRTIVFESAAQTDEGVMRAAKRSLEQTYEAESDRFVNGYTVFRSTPVGQMVPPKSDEVQEGENPTAVNDNLHPVPSDAPPDTPTTP
jgi:hypothetical protein